MGLYGQGVDSLEDERNSLGHVCGREGSSGEIKGVKINLQEDFLRFHKI